MHRTIFAKAAVAVAILLTPAVTASRGSAADSFACSPTELDEIGPFYRPNAPLRSRIGTGSTIWCQTYTIYFVKSVGLTPSVFRAEGAGKI